MALENTDGGAKILTAEDIELMLRTIKGYVDVNGDRHFRHTQDVASTDWTIQHGLNKHPSVVVIDSGGNVLMGDVAYIDGNTLMIHFSHPFSGVAYLN